MTSDRPAAGRPQRVRVTAPRRDDTERRPFPGPAPGDTAALYVRTLIRSQRRLAIVCAVAFIVILVAVPLVFVLVPSLDDANIGGVPVSWIVLGAGLFPVLITIAALYVRTASRNEARYRSLADDDA